MNKILCALFGLYCSGVAPIAPSKAVAATPTQLMIGVDKTVTPYNLQMNINNIWYTFGTITSGGIYEIVANSGSIIGTNPTVQGWSPSFNPWNLACAGTPATCYNNGVFMNFVADGGATYITNGVTENLILNSGYNKTLSGVSATPTAVAHQTTLQVNSGTGAGSDFWGLLGILDIQSPTVSGGCASCSIVRGNWSSVLGFAGIRSQAENYTGRAQYGMIIGSSQTDGVSAPFDNSYDTGVKVHQSHTYGIEMGGLDGATQGILPTYPIAVNLPNSSATLWRLTNNSNTTVDEYVSGNVTATAVTSSAASIPQFLLTSTTAGADLKNWGFISDTAGSLYFRAYNDAQNAANDAIVISRTGYVPTRATFNTPITGASAAPQVTLGDNAGNLGELQLKGSTSGALLIAPQAVAGTPTWTAGTSSGTPAVTASSPLAIASATGNISITGAAGQVLAGSSPAFTLSPTLGVQQTSQGSLILANTALGAFSTTLTSSNSSTAAWTMTLPPAAPAANGSVLSSTTAGVTSWASSVPVANGGTNCTSASITCFNNITGFTAAGATGTTSGNLVFSVSPTITTTAGASALTVNGGTQTADYPAINITQTWNNAGTTFNALLFNVTDTASAAGSNMLDLQLAGSSIFKIGKDGSFRMNGYELLSAYPAGAATPYNIMYDPANNPALVIGGGGGSPDATTYYRNTTHTFQSVNGGANYGGFGSTGLNAVAAYRLNGTLLTSATAPTISSGFGTTPSIVASNGTAAFQIDVGTGGTATNGVIGLPTAATGWVCNATDITTTNGTAFITKQTASSTTSATIGNFNTAGAAAAWSASDKLNVSCFAY